MVSRNSKPLEKGSRQRVAFASMLLIEPKVLVIDETITGQDPKMAREVLDTINEYNKRIIR